MEARNSWVGPLMSKKPPADLRGSWSSDTSGTKPSSAQLSKPFIPLSKWKICWHNVFCSLIFQQHNVAGIHTFAAGVFGVCGGQPSFAQGCPASFKGVFEIKFRHGNRQSNKNLIDLSWLRLVPYYPINTCVWNGLLLRTYHHIPRTS